MTEQPDPADAQTRASVLAAEEGARAATRRASIIITRLAEQYESTAKAASTPELEFVAREIADALRRCDRAVTTGIVLTTPATGMEAFIEKRPTRKDLSDKMVDL